MVVHKQFVPFIPYISITPGFQVKHFETTTMFKPLNTATFRLLSEITLVPKRKGEVIEVRERGSQILTCLERLPLIDTSPRT